MKRVFLLLMMITMILSCKKDDGNNIPSVPPRLLADVIAEDAKKIQEYLKTHFYNYEEFLTPPAGFDYRIKLDTIAGDNAGKTPLIDQMAVETVNVSSSHYGLSVVENDIPHTFYYLSVREEENIGSRLSVSDSVYVRYEGSLLNGSVFDGSLNVPIWFDLARIQGPQQGARGFSEGTSKFKSGGPAVINDDGTFSVDDYGIGFMIFPSGLGYYNTAQPTIPAYSPLIFKVDVFAVNPTDHDRDGIPSADEDLNGNGYMYDDNTDGALEDANRFVKLADFLDTDDDGDGVLTKDEISDDDGNIIKPYPDTDKDGNPDYRDSDS